LWQTADEAMNCKEAKNRKPEFSHGWNTDETRIYEDMDWSLSLSFIRVRSVFHPRLRNHQLRKKKTEGNHGSTAATLDAWLVRWVGDLALMAMGSKCA